MSYEMKDILKTMIDNNEPPWSADTMDMARVEIHNVYAQAAKADEYEAKAIILDRVKEFSTEPPFLLANNEHEDYELYAYDQILRLIEKYESGGYDAKNDEVDYCAKCTVKPIVKEHMCDECYAEHCQWLSELSAPKQDSAQWYTLYESKA